MNFFQIGWNFIKSMNFFKKDEHFLKRWSMRLIKLINAVNWIYQVSFFFVERWNKAIEGMHRSSDSWAPPGKNDAYGANEEDSITSARIIPFCMFFCVGFLVCILSFFSRFIFLLIYFWFFHFIFIFISSLIFHNLKNFIK